MGACTWWPGGTAGRPRQRVRLHTRALQFAVAFGACLLSGDAEHVHSPLAWCAASEAMAVGSAVAVSGPEAAPERQMRGLGFVAHGSASYVREVSLNAPVAARHLPEAASEQLGAVSVLSIDRGSPEEPYLYSTLRALFAELPQTAPINVFVGDDKLAYVAPQRLTRVLGPEQAARVHVLGTDASMLAYMATANFTRSERASWNYARLLRAYRGGRWHLAFEDDVALAPGSLAAFAELARTGDVDVVSLYNHRCHAGDEARPVASVEKMPGAYFWGTQAMAYRAGASFDLGVYIQAYLGTMPYDLLVHASLTAGPHRIGYAVPSMAQHLGLSSTGLGKMHTSPCFPARYPGATSSGPLAERIAR